MEQPSEAPKPAKKRGGWIGDPENAARGRKAGTKKMKAIGALGAGPEVQATRAILEKRAVTLADIVEEAVSSGSVRDYCNTLLHIWRDGYIKKAKLPGEEGPDEFERIEDNDFRLRALESWGHRVLGKPGTNLAVDKAENASIKFLQLQINRAAGAIDEANREAEVIITTARPVEETRRASSALSGDGVPVPQDGAEGSEGVESQPGMAGEVDW